MRAEARPPTIDGDWDRFYLEFPDVYDRFALHDVRAVEQLTNLFDVAGATIIDSGAGTGLSTFASARCGRFVVGVEPWAPMRQVAIRKARAPRRPAGPAFRRHRRWVSSPPRW